MPTATIGGFASARSRLNERDEFGDTVAVRVARPKGEGSEVGTEPLVVLFLWPGEEYQEGFNSQVGDREVCQRGEFAEEGPRSEGSVARARSSVKQAVCTVCECKRGEGRCVGPEEVRDRFFQRLGVARNLECQC